jgi:DNA-binding SARP family transcriptional activator/tetratricopeptide (TPR) repeat protein
MEFFLLGPVFATAAGRPAGLGRRQERLLLALLLLEVGKPVPAGRLIDLMWPYQPPRDPQAAIHVYVSRLRRRLAAAGADQAAARIVTVGTGYAIEADPGSVDVHRFTSQAAAASDLADPAQRATMLAGALALWRGDLMADVASPDLRGRLGSQLTELRLAALEMRIEAELELGRADRLIPELADLSARFPGRERLVMLRMLALYRAGRQRDALSVYGLAAQTLAEQFGLDPGAALRQLRTAILRQDPQLALGGLVTAPVRPAAPSPAQLPAEAEGFVGRVAELAALAATAAATASRPAVVTITGMAGVGKTALAIRAGHQLADRFPGGQLFLDLHGFTAGLEPVAPATALDRLLHSLGVPAERIPETTEDRAALYRSQLAVRRVLIVLDNAASEGQVVPLLPGGPGCLVLITSRLSLAGLDSGAPLALGVLSGSDAELLLGRLLGDHPASTGQAAALAEVVELCGFLPLAVRLAASRLRHRGSWSVAYLAERLHDVHGRLSELHAGERSIDAAIRLSDQCLTSAQRELFQILGLLPCSDVDGHAAAAAAAAADPAQTERILEQLVDAHLLEQPAPGRYRFHDLVRLYAARSATETFTAADRRRIRNRLAGYYLDGASAAMHTLAPHQMRAGQQPSPPGSKLPPLARQAQAQAWLDTERANLLAVALAQDEDGPAGYARDLPEILFPYLQTGAHVGDALRLYEHARQDASRRGDEEGEARALSSLGAFHRRAGHASAALDCLRRSLVIHLRVSDHAAQCRALTALGFVCLTTGLHDEALDCLTRAIALHRAHRGLPGEGYALRVISNLYWILGQHREAMAAAEQAAALSRAAGFTAAEAYALLSLGIYTRRLGRNEEALAHFGRAAELLIQIGDRSGHSHALAGLGSVRAALGQNEQADVDFRAALALAHETGEPDAEFQALSGRGEALRRAGRLDEALSHDQAALELVEELGQPRDHLIALDGVARTLQAMGRTGEARGHWERALEHYSDADVLEVAGIRARLAALSSNDPRSVSELRTATSGS